MIERLAAAAGLGNATAVPERAEEWARRRAQEAYDVVTARALAPLAVLAEYAAPLLADGGALVAWKGRRDEDEERAGAAAADALGMAPVQVVRVVPYRARATTTCTSCARWRRRPSASRAAPGQARKRPLA